MLLKTNWLRFFSALVVLLCLDTVPAIGNWSTPPEVIYSMTEANIPGAISLATDGAGNSVATWIDDTGSGSLQAATLVSGAVNALGQPAWVLTNPVAASNVFKGTAVLDQMVGMDFNGKATAVWSDATYIYAATLMPGSSTWSTPVIISTPVLGRPVRSPSIAVNSKGDAIVVWASMISGENEFNILSNIFDADSLSWKGQEDVLGAGIIFAPAGYGARIPLSIDPNGNGVISFHNSTDNTQAARYSFGSNTWATIPTAAVNDIVTTSNAMDAAGNATIIWFEYDGTEKAATLPFNQTSLTNIQTLSTTVSVTTFGWTAVVVDGSGNAVAAWADESGNLASARYSFTAQTWSILPLLTTEQDTIIYYISLSSDRKGNVVATWVGGQIAMPAVVNVQAAALDATASLWTLLTTLSSLSSLSGFFSLSQVIVTVDGDAIDMWDTVYTSGGTISSSIFLNLFSPLPPSYFRGNVTNVKFLSQTDRIHLLKWGASPTPQVVEYRIYRNSVLIATIPANGLVFSYQDHNRSKKVSDTYKIVAVNTSGYESDPLFVTLK